MYVWGEKRAKKSTKESSLSQKCQTLKQLLYPLPVKSGISSYGI